MLSPGQDGFRLLRFFRGSESPSLFDLRLFLAIPSVDFGAVHIFRECKLVMKIIMMTVMITAVATTAKATADSICRQCRSARE